MMEVIRSLTSSVEHLQRKVNTLEQRLEEGYQRACSDRARMDDLQAEKDSMIAWQSRTIAEQHSQNSAMYATAAMQPTVHIAQPIVCQSLPPSCVEGGTNYEQQWQSWNMPTWSAPNGALQAAVAFSSFGMASGSEASEAKHGIMNGVTVKTIMMIEAQ